MILPYARCKTQYPQTRCTIEIPAPHLVLILTCLTCDRGYIIDGTLCAQVCPACGTILVLSQIWDLSREAAPAGWVWHGKGGL